MNDDRQSTHWPGCWQERGHHDCAIARVRELEKDRERMDWMDANPKRVVPFIGGWIAGSADGADWAHDWTHRATLREAIDAARAEDR